MNFIKILFIIGVLTLSANSVFALTYNDEIPINSKYEKIKESEISAAKLLQDYVESYEEKINTLLESYNSENTEIITVVNKALKQMSQSLDIIQRKNVNPLVVNDIMVSIVTDLKNINNRMKIYLEQEKEIHENKIKSIQEKYNVIGIKISKILDKLIFSLSNNLIQKESLTEKEKEIVRSLAVIRQENNKIKGFKNLTFSSQDEMKSYFQNIILKIKGEIISMKQK